MLYTKTFPFKITLSKNIFFFKIMLFKIARKTQKVRFLPDKLNWNVIFCVQRFFQNLLFENFFVKIVLFKNVYFLQNRAF